jgi:ABC-type tungstate transport system permease subunit
VRVLTVALTASSSAARHRLAISTTTAPKLTALRTFVLTAYLQFVRSSSISYARVRVARARSAAGRPARESLFNVVT